ncbi:MAG: hypothetical protein ACJAS4_002483 [Bacteriovoracaceae bacterium]|jgi:hypothetical protein
MKLIVLIVLIIGAKTSLAGTRENTLPQVKAKKCKSIDDSKKVICGDRLSNGNLKISEYKLTNLLIDKLDSNGYDYELSTVFKNVKIESCVEEQKLVKQVACVNLEKLENNDKENIASYVEDLF